ncbi:2187_t:CDS:2 [Entrophospora sp. SA101]|nr:2187_t:CDS:2 [Entrophospora sp. SA101]
MEFVNIDNKVSEEFSYAEIIETVHPSQNNEVAEDEDEGIEPEPSIPVKKIKDSLNIVKMVNQIQPPALNEISTTFDTFLDENGHDYIIRNPQTSAWNQRDILNKIITVNDSVHGLQDIAEWENTQAQTQYQRDANTVNQLNNFATQFQTQNYQDAQTIAQLQA